MHVPTGVIHGVTCELKLGERGEAGRDEGGETRVMLPGRAQPGGGTEGVCRSSSGRGGGKEEKRGFVGSEQSLRPCWDNRWAREG